MTDGAVQPTVIEPVDVFEGRDLELIDRPPGAATPDEFCLEEPMLDSAMALSNESPTVPIDGMMP